METRFDESDLSDELLCPITQEIFVDPVIASPCGHSFEKTAILKWAASHSSCPVCTREIYSNFTPNISLRNLVHRLLSDYPEKLFSPEFVHKLIKEDNVALIIKILKARPEKLNEGLVDGQNALHLATYEGKKKVIEALIQNFPELNLNAIIGGPGVSKKKQTPILLASHATNANPEIVKFLLSQGADPNYTLDNGSTPLIVTIWNSQWMRTKALIESGKVTNFNQALTNSGSTALILAIEKDCPLDVFSELLAIPNMDVNYKRSNGESALFIAAEKGAEGLVAALLTHPNIDVEAKRIPGDGKTAFEIAAAKGHAEVVALFTHPKTKFILLKSKLKEQNIPSAVEIFTEIYNDNNADVISYLKEIDRDYKSSYTAFCKSCLPRMIKRAIEKNDIDFILALFRAVPDQLNAPLVYGQTVLHLTCSKGKIQILRALLDNFKELDINVRCTNSGSNGATPLLFAVCQSHHTAEIADYLIEQGADPALKSTTGVTPLLAALLPFNKECVNVLLDSKKDLNMNASSTLTDRYALIEAARYCDSDTFIKVLENDKKTQVNLRNHDGESAFFIAASIGDEDKVKILLARYDVDLEAARNDGKTPDIIALEQGHKSIAAILSCYHLLSSILKDEPINEKIKLDFLDKVDEKTLNILFLRLEYQGYNKQILAHLFDFLLRLKDRKNPTSSIFDNQNGFFKNPKLRMDETKILNELFTIAHNSYYTNSVDWEKLIRKTAFHDLETSGNDSSNKQDLDFLKWVRKQTIFDKHRYLLSVRPPRTARKIDDMIHEIEHPKLQ